LVAERRDQPIEQRRRIAILNGGSDTDATIIVANHIKEVGRASKATNAMDQPNGVIDGRGLATTNFGPAWPNR
jgi:hypothetical protein